MTRFLLQKWDSSGQRSRPELSPWPYKYCHCEPTPRKRSNLKYLLSSF